MNIRRLIHVMEEHKDCEAIIHNENKYLYRDILDRVNEWSQTLKERDIGQGAVVVLIGDYSLDSISLVIALILNRNIIVPLSPSGEKHFHEYFNIVKAQHIINLSETTFDIKNISEKPPENKILKGLVKDKRAGLILFTSGSSGSPKAAVHDFDRLLSKFLKADKPFRTLCFLLFDHIAGIDTYFYILYSGGTAVITNSRQPDGICKTIERHRVEVLPASPTFLNMLLISGVYKEYDLKSLKMVTFGSERASGALVKKFKEIFGSVKLIQKYGVTELGAPSSRTNPSDATLIKVDSENFRIRVIDGILHVKTTTAMLGYLNAPSPFTDDGWFNTGDSVEIEGEYIRILGRESEIINVGGEKVYPAEIESVIEEMENVLEAIVYPEKNPLVGNVVCAKVLLLENEDKRTFLKRLKKYCLQRLEQYKIPVKVELIDETMHSDRYKKIRY